MAVFGEWFCMAELFGGELWGRAPGVSCGGATLGNKQIA